MLIYVSTKTVTKESSKERLRTNISDCSVSPLKPTNIFNESEQRTITYLVRGSITVWLAYCLTGLDSTEQVNRLLIQHKQSN